MKYPKIFYPVFIIILLFTLLHAVENYTPQIEDPILENWRWRHFSKLDEFGLRCITEDREHNMWFGGDNKIIKYDGLSWENIYEFTDDKRDIPTDIILPTSDGRLFVNSAIGLRTYENKEWKMLLPISYSPKFVIRDMIELNDGSILFASNIAILHLSKNNALNIYTSKDYKSFFKKTKKDAQIHFLPNQLLVDSEVSAFTMLQAQDKTIWFAIGYTTSQNGKIITAQLGESGQLKNFKLKYSENKKIKFIEGTILFQDASGTIWNLTTKFDQGITTFKNGKISKFKLSTKFGNDDIYTGIVQADDGTIFIGGNGRFFTLKNKIWKEYSAPTVPIPSSTRILLHKDSNGNIWIAGYKNEMFLLEYTDRNWATYMNLNFEAQEENGTRWFIDIKGKVIKNSGNDWLAYTEKDGLMSHPVRVTVTKRKQIWATGSHHGTAASAYFDNGNWQLTLYPKLSWNIEERAVYEDYNGSLWFGANINYIQEKGQKGGLIKIFDPVKDKNNYRHYTTPHVEVAPYGIGQSKNKKILLAGTDTQYIENDTIKHLLYPYKLRSKSDCLFTDKDSVIWIGSRYYGIFRYDGKNWTNITVKNGLINNSITNINVISDSAIWVATAKDISFFDGKSWTNRVFPAKMNIYKEGGEIRTDLAGNLWINKSSREWYRRVLTNDPLEIIKKKGFRTVFHHRDPVAPETIIKHYEKKVSQIGNTTIAWTGIDPYEKTSTDNLQFSYKIDREKWSPFSTQKNHFFTALAPGKHTFEIRSRDHDFNIGDSKEIHFYVLYPFYLRPAFFIPILLLLSLSGILIFRIIKKGKQLRQAKKETDEILRNIKQGLFLLDNEFRLGSQFSDFLKTIFKEEDLTNKYFIDLIKDKITAENVEAIESYLEISFRNEIDINMLDDLNPFEEIKFIYENNSESKYFSFLFRRVIAMDDRSKIESLIVVVQDITEQITLGKQLEAVSEDATKKMNWLLDILHVEPGLLQEFLNSSENELQKIFGILDSPEILKNPMQYMETIYRSMHLLKGNAGLLELNSFAEETHRVEDIISQYQKDGSIKDNDIKILRSMIEKISGSIHDVINLLDKLSDIHKQMRTEGSNGQNQLIRSLNDLVKRISKKEGKNTKLISDKFNISHFPKNKKLTTREIITQLLKNSIVHGIESAEERISLSKSEIGTIEISSFKNSKEYGFKIKDDGHGIQIAKLRNKLINSPKYNEEMIKSWNDNEIAMSIFFSGISTADKVNINAGRGVGLDAVKDKVESFGGKIDIDFKKNEFSEFTITFPI